MLRVLLLLSVSVVLSSCGDDTGTDCGPNPCGACAVGCTNADSCTSSGWSCECVCADGGGMDGGSDGGGGDGGGDTSVADGGGDTAVDAAPDAAADTMNPVGCPADATGMCDPMGLVCRYDDRVCTCEPPCSGVDPGPDPPTNWACALRPRACPETTPMSGASCPMSGLTCVYGTCGGSTATCVGGTWTVMSVPPPP